MAIANILKNSLEEEAKGEGKYHILDFNISCTGQQMQTILKEFEKQKQKAPFSIEEGTLHEIKYIPNPPDFQKRLNSNCSCACTCACEFTPSLIPEIEKLLEEEITNLPSDDGVYNVESLSFIRSEILPSQGEEN